MSWERDDDSIDSDHIGTELTSHDFVGKCTELAKSLIGDFLFYNSQDGLSGGRIVETEAYLGANDPACHLSSGRTKRTKPFFGGKGTIYVFKIYRYNNLNIISEYKSHPECILIRAIEPTHGIDLMKERRGTTHLTELTTGPGKMTEALGITKGNLNDTPLDESSLTIRRGESDDFEVTQTGRIGLSKAEGWPLRYAMKDNDYLSKNVNRPLDNSLDLSSYYRELTSQTRLTLSESISSD